MEGRAATKPTDFLNQEDPLETLRKELVSLSPLRCIYRVPNRLRRVRKEAYTPRVISIGPFHHGKEALKAMEDHKKRYLLRFMSRYNLKLKDYIKKMKDQEAKLRNCYPESIEFSSDDFVRIILVDAIFVIELLLKYSDLVPPDDDCIFRKPRMIEDVIPDLLMLENQLPFFILKDIFHPLNSEYFHEPADFVEKLATEFLYKRVLCHDKAYEGVLPEYIWRRICSSGEVQHFVDLLRKIWITPLSNEPSMSRKKKTATAPSIEKLHLAGVKFKPRSTTNLFDIRFRGGILGTILEIPKVKTGNLTELLLRNLVAFEQCSDTSNDYYITDYVKIMDELVDTPKDVELLVKNKIVENDLGGGDHDLSSLINSLSTGLMYDPDNFYYGDLSEKLDNYYRGKCHRWMANLRRNYFRTPWQTISFAAAVVLLIFTAVQTICSIMSLK